VSCVFFKLTTLFFSFLCSIIYHINDEQKVNANVYTCDGQVTVVFTEKANDT